MDEDGAGAGQLLEDEALAAEQPGPEALGERDAHVHAVGRAQERVALAEPVRRAGEVELFDLSGVGGREGDLALAAPAEAGHEQALSRHQAAQAAEQAAAHAALHVDAARHVEQCPGLGLHLLTVGERDHDRLHDVADDVEFLGPSARGRSRGGRAARRAEPRAGGEGLAALRTCHDASPSAARGL